jgi:hypothetical protein
MNFFQDTHLKPTTYKTYNVQLNTWLSLFPSDQANIVFLYTHPNYSVVTLRKHLASKNQNNPRMVNSYIKPVMAAIHANRSLFLQTKESDIQTSQQRWKEMLHQTYQLAFAYRIHQEPSSGQAEKSGVSLKMDDLLHARDALQDGSINKLLIGFYTHIPPVRADYFATQIIRDEDPTEPNYIRHTSHGSHLVLTDFKTSSLYKEIRHDLPPELHRQLTLSLAAQPRSYLFVNKNGHPFTRNGFTRWAITRLHDIFKKDLTLTMLRHIYISSLDLNSSPAQLIEIGLKMGHHVTQQMLYKWKDTPDLGEL